jgi:hypothetical protein
VTNVFRVFGTETQLLWYKYLLQDQDWFFDIVSLDYIVAHLNAMNANLQGSKKSFSKINKQFSWLKININYMCLISMEEVG